ncbi:MULTISPECIES: hypothetical protein, partial [unclassified Pseudomonas]
DESSQDKGRAGHTVAKVFTLSYVVTADLADAYRDFTPIPCGSLSHAGVRTHTSAGYDLCPARTNPNKAKGGWPYRASRLFFFKMSALRRSEAVHLKFAARQRSPEGLGDLPQGNRSL